MRFFPTKIHPQFLCFIVLSILVLISCSKDSDLLRDAVISDAEVSVEETSEAIPEEDIVEEIEEPVSEEEIEEEVATTLESRTTSFPALNDAHFQSGKGFNQNIIRLEEGNRTSYLMFDLSAIEQIEAEIIEASLQFTISSDDGNGNITVYKGVTNEWTEEDLGEATKPELGEEVGSITKEYEIGATEAIALSASKITPEVNTLILDHKNGNDLAFASKEHATKSGPKLVITYMAPIEAEEIVPPIEEETLEETAEEQENQEPIAIADGTPTTGKAPLEVTFSGSNSSDDNEIVSYTWTFEEGASSTEADPKHTFATVGSYEVTLTVADEEGLKNTDTVLINVTDEENKAPVAVLIAAPKSGEAPLEVSFDASQSTDDNGVISYAWDFKDGNTASNAKPVHTFTNPGNYEVELTIKDENGLAAKKDIIITVTEPVNEKPVAIVSANKTTGEAPLAVQFTGSNSTDDKKVESYSWNFKDGSNSSSSNPSHTFDNAGTYVVELTVTDEEGLTDKKTISITASEPQTTNEAPKASSTSNVTSGEAPLVVNFRGDQSTDDDAIVSYAYDFDDGATSTEANPTHTFENPGTYQVAFTVTDSDGATDTDIDTITVTEAGNGGGNTGGSNGNYPSHAVFASSYGFQAGDATEAFEDAINSSNSYIVIDKQSSDWIIEPTTFFDTRNKTIIFEPGVVLRAKSGAFSDSNDNLVALVRPENLTIEGYDATFQMVKSEYNSGEFRHTLSIWGGENIAIRGLTFKDSGGDGIFIGRSNSKSYSSDIIIEDIVCSNNRRQGMSIISAQNVWVRNSEFIGTSGANPEAGVDLEPDNANERLVNINFSNCKFANNDSYGLLIATLKLNSSSIPISVTVKDSEFSYNFKSPNSGYKKSEVHFNQGEGNNPVKGEVNFDNVTFNGSKYSAVSSRKSAESYKVIFRDCVAKNISQNGSAPISLEAHESANTLGGFDFGNFRIEYTSNANFMKINAPSGSFRVKDIQGNFTVIEPNDNPIEYTGGYNESNNINVDINYTHQ